MTTLPDALKAVAAMDAANERGSNADYYTRLRQREDAGAACIAYVRTLATQQGDRDAHLPDEILAAIVKHGGWRNMLAKLDAAVQVDDAKDAARYRWLRSSDVGPATIDRLLFETISEDCNPPFRTMKYGLDLDAAIDAALAHKGNG